MGKVAIPDAILDKPGPLDDAEWEFMRRHTIIGQRILQAAPALERVASIVRSTRERMDGTGHPDRLAGDAIPLAARIVRGARALRRHPVRPARRRGLPRAGVSPRRGRGRRRSQ